MIYQKDINNTRFMGKRYCLCVDFYTLIFSIFSKTNSSYDLWLLSCSFKIFKSSIYFSKNLQNNNKWIINKTKPSVLIINNCLILDLPISADFSQNRLHRMESMVGILMENRQMDCSNWMKAGHRVCGLYMYILVWQWIVVWVFEWSLWVLE